MAGLKHAIEKCGGVSAVAERLGVSAQRLSNWTERGVPTEHCAALERALAGYVTRRDMRPNDWHRIWPELIGGLGEQGSQQHLAKEQVESAPPAPVHVDTGLRRRITDVERGAAAGGG